MKRGPLLIRADASATMGTGHAMRCLALAEAWQDSGGDVVFAMAESGEAVRERLLAESCEVRAVSGRAGSEDDSRQLTALAVERQAEWVVVDGYQFGAEYQDALKMAGVRVLLLDDYGHAAHYSADLILNQNVCASAEMYADREPRTRLLLGPRYCLLRREFIRRRGWERKISHTARRVLVTMGGSDPENLTQRAISALDLVSQGDVEAIVVTGGSNPRRESLRQLGARCNRPGPKVSVQAGVSDMAELMAWADVAIAAAGSTCWELCFMGLPSLLIDAAENQKGLAQELHRLGCAIHLGGARDVLPAKIAEQLGILLDGEELRRSLSQRCRQLVDGEGAARVAAILSHRLQLRPARIEDARLLWEWANDPDVRAASFSSASISWEEHLTWFRDKLRQDGCLILIGQDQEGDPVGQIRFDATVDGDFEVGVSVVKAKRGHGLASELIRHGVRALLAQKSCNRVHAYAKPVNAASVNAFQQADFKRIGTTEIRGNAAVHLIFDRKTNGHP